MSEAMERINRLIRENATAAAVDAGERRDDLCLIKRELSRLEAVEANRKGAIELLSGNPEKDSLHDLIRKFLKELEAHQFLVRRRYVDQEVPNPKRQGWDAYMNQQRDGAHLAVPWPPGWTERELWDEGWKLAEVSAGRPLCGLLRPPKHFKCHVCGHHYPETQLYHCQSLSSIQEVEDKDITEALDEADCSALSSALDDIVQLCAAPDWQYAGQVVCDVHIRLEELRDALINHLVEMNNTHGEWAASLDGIIAELKHVAEPFCKFPPEGGWKRIRSEEEE